MAMGMGGTGGVGPAGAKNSKTGAGFGGAKGFGGNGNGNPQGYGAGPFGRQTVTPIATRPATLGNLAKLGLSALPGSGLINAAMGLINGTMDPYSGPIGTGAHINSDPVSGMNVGQMMSGPRGFTLMQQLRNQLYPGGPQLPIPGQAQQPQPQQPKPMALKPQTVPAATLGGPIPGLQDYTLNLPAYGYFGAPGQVRPQAASLSY